MNASATDRLQNRDYTLIIDKSGSMGDTRDYNGKSRWEVAREGTVAIAREINKYDPDGITVYPFAGSFKRYDNVTPDKVEQIFTENSPMGGTDLAGVLKDALQSFQNRKAKGELKANGEIILVVTDGEPNDRDAVKKVIVDATKKLDNGDGELGISFIQIGKDGTASQFLKSLDDDLVKIGAKFDIVDTKTFDEIENMSFQDVLIAALDD